MSFSYCVTQYYKIHGGGVCGEMVAEYQKTLTGFLICVESVSSLQFQVHF